ncbi:thermonuclease family protein [Aeromonas hydrophila]|uniref:thermonuclease family protein n=1 Tax=Aeromonas hydrophila TaxID=644 RepID=UPI002B47262D|nr:hypothetical protein [Aeromonas hydrophila]
MRVVIATCITTFLYTPSILATNGSNDPAIYVIKGVVEDVTSPNSLIIRTKSNKIIHAKLAWVNPPKQIDLMNPFKDLPQNSTAGVSPTNKYQNTYANAYSNQFDNKFNNIYKPSSKSATSIKYGKNFINQPGYVESFKFLQKAISKNVDCEVDSGTSKQAILCDLYGSDGTWYNAELVLKGLATVQNGSPAVLKVMEKTSKEKKEGNWKAGFMEPDLWQMQTLKRLNLIKN